MSSSSSSSSVLKPVALVAGAALLFGLIAAQRRKVLREEKEEKKAREDAKAKLVEVKAPAPAGGSGSFGLRGKAAIVTGSTSGIGVEVARSLAAQGVNLIMHGSRPESEAKEVAQVRAEFKDVKIVYCQAPLDKPEESANVIINTCVKEFGRLDILVNNAGVQHVSPLPIFPAVEWDRLLAINLTAPFHLMKLAIPLMKKNADQFGRIINISSVHGVVASIDKGAYIATKHGLNGLSKVAALECAASSNITVNSICPGFVLTPLVQKQIDTISTRDSLSNEAATVKLVSVKQPRPKFTDAAAIGAYVVFLSSPAGDNITGGQQLIDGAWSVQ